MQKEPIMSRAMQQKRIIDESIMSYSDNPFLKPVERGGFEEFGKDIEDLEEKGLLNQNDRFVLREGFSVLYDRLFEINDEDFPDVVTFPDTAARPLAPGVKVVMDILAKEKDVEVPDYQYMMLFSDSAIAGYGEALLKDEVEAWEREIRDELEEKKELIIEYEGELDIEKKLAEYKDAWQACYDRVCEIARREAKRLGRDEVKMLIVDDYYAQGRSMKLFKMILDKMRKDGSLPTVKPMYFAFYGFIDYRNPEESAQMLDDRISNQIGGIAWHGVDYTTAESLKRYSAFEYASTLDWTPKMYKGSRWSKQAKIGVKKKMGEKYTTPVKYNPDEYYERSTKNMRRLRRGIEEIAYDVLDEKYGIKKEEKPPESLRARIEDFNVLDNLTQNR